MLKKARKIQEEYLKRTSKGWKPCQNGEHDYQEHLDILMCTRCYSYRYNGK